MQIIIYILVFFLIGKIILRTYNCNGLSKTQFSSYKLMTDNIYRNIIQFVKTMKIYYEKSRVPMSRIK